MSVTKCEISDFNKLTDFLKRADDKSGIVFLLFTAGKREDGVRWCPDCVKAEPEINQFLNNSFNKDFTLVTVDLERTYFKDVTNPFYTSEEFKLRKVPTLMKWKGSKQLLEEDCWNEKHLKSLFEPVL